MSESSVAYLEEMKNVDIKTVDPKKLVDIRNTTVDTNLPRGERIKKFIEQIKNPYCYKVGNIVVKVQFNDTQQTLEDKLEKYLLTL